MLRLRSVLTLCILMAAVSAPSTAAAQDDAAGYFMRAGRRALPSELGFTSHAERYSSLRFRVDVQDIATPARNYLDEQLLVRDSTIRRWRERVDSPIRVWIQGRIPSRVWHEDFPTMVREAIDEWESVGLPVRFAEVGDSATAEIHVLWADQLGQDESGRTVWWSTSRGWITRARVTLSMHASDGLPQTPGALRAVAMHELGHALGLGHTADARNIMAPWVEVSALSDADRNTARLLYRMQVGRVRDAISTGAAGMTASDAAPGRASPPTVERP